MRDTVCGMHCVTLFCIKVSDILVKNAKIKPHRISLLLVHMKWMNLQ